MPSPHDHDDYREVEEDDYREVEELQRRPPQRRRHRRRAELIRYPGPCPACDSLGEVVSAAF